VVQNCYLVSAVELRLAFLRHPFATRDRDPDIHVVDILPPQTPPKLAPYCVPGRDLLQVSSNLTGRVSCGGGFLSGPVIIACSEGISGIHRRQGSSYNNGMIHEILPVGPLQCNCSIIGDETTREAMVIDPGDNIQEILVLVGKHNLQVKQIVITHAHIDHVGGAMKTRAATGAQFAQPE
jgi:hypothetical protein